MFVWHIEWCERGVGDWSDDVEDGRVGVGSSSGEGEGDILDPELKKWAKTQLTIFINWDFNWRPSWSPLIWSSSSMDQKPNRQYQVGFKVSINWKPSSVLAILKHFNIIFTLRHVSLHFLLHPNQSFVIIFIINAFCSHIHAGTEWKVWEFEKYTKSTTQPSLYQHHIWNKMRRNLPRQHIGSNWD